MFSNIQKLSANAHSRVKTSVETNSSTYATAILGTAVACGACGVSLLAWKCASYLRKKPPITIANKIVIVTGCDTGFGNLTAKRLDSMGAITFALCLKEDTRKKLDDETSKNCHTMIMDVTNQDQIDRVVAEIRAFCEENGHSSVWGLVNNAGIGNGGPFEYITQEAFEKVLNVNFYGVVNMTRSVLPLIRANLTVRDVQERSAMTSNQVVATSGINGRVVNISSAAGRLPTPGFANYGTSKWAVIGFSDSLRGEIATRFGIYVSTIEPFFYSTQIIARSEFNPRNFNEDDELASLYGNAAERKKVDEEMMDDVRDNVAGNPEEVVDVIIDALTSQNPQENYSVPYYLVRSFRWIGLLAPGMFLKGAADDFLRNKDSRGVSLG